MGRDTLPSYQLDRERVTNGEEIQMDQNESGFAIDDAMGDDNVHCNHHQNGGECPPDEDEAAGGLGPSSEAEDVVV